MDSRNVLFHTKFAVMGKNVCSSKIGIAKYNSNTISFGLKIMPLEMKL